MQKVIAMEKAIEKETMKMKQWMKKLRAKTFLKDSLKTMLEK